MVINHAQSPYFFTRQIGYQDEGNYSYRQRSKVVATLLEAKIIKRENALYECAMIPLLTAHQYNA